MLKLVGHVGYYTEHSGLACVDIFDFLPPNCSGPGCSPGERTNGFSNCTNTCVEAITFPGALATGSTLVDKTRGTRLELRGPWDCNKLFQTPTAAPVLDNTR